MVAHITSWILDLLIPLPTSLTRVRHEMRLCPIGVECKFFFSWWKRSLLITINLNNRIKDNVIFYSQNDIIRANLVRVIWKLTRLISVQCNEVRWVLVSLNTNTLIKVFI